MPGFCTGSPSHTLIMHFQRTTGSDCKCQTLIKSHNLWCSSRLRLPCHAYLSLLITNPYVTIITENTQNWSLLGSEHVSQSLAGAHACFYLAGVIKESCQSSKPLTSFAFSLPQTADLFMAVSNSLSTANISNLSVQNKVEVYAMYLKKKKLICLSPI